MFSAREYIRPTNQFLEPNTLSRMISLVFQMSAIVMASGRSANKSSTQKLTRLILTKRPLANPFTFTLDQALNPVGQFQIVRCFIISLHVDGGQTIAVNL